jgi:hypothetical protein
VEVCVLYLPNYTVALRCIGQALQRQNIELFELKSDGDDFRVQAANPNPPYIGIIDLRFSLNDIKILDREGLAQRRQQSNSEFRFDSLPEILRAIGKYVDDKRGTRLCRLNNCCLSDQDAVEIEYQTRREDVRSEILSISVIREIGVNMYKERNRVPNRIKMVTH